MVLTPEELHQCHRWIPLDEVALLPGNPNQGDSESLRASVGEFGWVDGIVVNRGTVIAGNHRVELARAAGEDGLPGYDLTRYGVSDTEAMAIALAHNHTTRAGTDDPDLLRAALAALGPLAALPALPSPPPLPGSTDAVGGGPGPPGAPVCPRCGGQPK